MACRIRMPNEATVRATDIRKVGPEPPPCNGCITNTIGTINTGCHICSYRRLKESHITVYETVIRKRLIK